MKPTDWDTYICIQQKHRLTPILIVPSGVEYLKHHSLSHSLSPHGSVLSELSNFFSTK